MFFFFSHFQLPTIAEISPGWTCNEVSCNETLSREAQLGKDAENLTVISFDN